MMRISQFGLSFIFSILLFISCRNQASSGSKNDGKDSQVYYPYSPVVGNSYEKGKEQHALAVLEFWRAYETGDVSKTSVNFDDTIVFNLPGRVLRGQKDEILKQVKKMRESYQDMQCYVDSWMPVQIKESGQYLVYLWGRQDGTTSNGKRDYLVLHEIWRFDNKNRIIKMEQYLTHPH
jgi:hypothetical protein